MAICNRHLLARDLQSQKTTKKLPSRTASFKIIAKLANTFFEKIQPKLSSFGGTGRGLHYLGNITHQVNTSNTVVAEYNFDAWGRRRNPTDWSYTLTGQPALFADRGFTGHEYLPWFNLYNMNGRLYDPLVGRFLSVDPYVQNPGSTQSYNRYSYCLNNPLKYTDPSGEKLKWPKFEWRHLIPVIGQLEYVMQTINDNTTELSQKMDEAGVPSFNVGGTVNLDGNVNANASVNGQQVLNTANIDRSGPSVKATYDELAQVRKDYGSAWYASTVSGASGVAGDIASMSNSTFRLTKSGSFSPGYYSSGWSTGNQYVNNLYSVSKVGTGVSTGASLITTGLAYNQIYNGSAQTMTYVDASVGTAGLMASYALYFHGVEIPVVGEFVAVYGALRLSWDFGWYMGANYGPIGAYYGTNRWSGR